MDALELAAVNRANAALTAISNGHEADNRAKAKAFRELAWTLLRSPTPGSGIDALRACGNSLVEKAAAHALGDDIWEQGAAELAAAYLGSIAEGSLLETMIRYAAYIPAGTTRVMLASDSVGDVVAEGDPKPVRRLNLSLGDVTPKKAVAIVVTTQELANATGGAGQRMFDAELSASVNRACNQSILAELLSSNTIDVTGTGDPLSDLRAGLRAAGPSIGYVVAAPSGDVADLATREANRGGMGIRGGTFVPGVEIVAIDDATSMTIIPASRFSIWDGGLQVRSAEHASIDMRDTPESPAQLVSLWQTGSLGLLVERSWHLAQAAEVVVVEPASP